MVDENRKALIDEVIGFQEELIEMFTGKGDLNKYKDIRNELLRHEDFSEIIPKFIRRCRDGGALWSFAKGVDPSWEPRRQFVREQFEPLLDFLETPGQPTSPAMPGKYDSDAWTGAQSPAQKAHAVRTLIPVAQASIEALIQHLEVPSHNGGPPLEEVDEAIHHLKKLHSVLGALLDAAEDQQLGTSLGEGLIAEAARYGKRAAKALKYDPLPYALSAAVLAIFTACGFSGIGGYLSGMALAIRKPSP
jgi:hypothetical protein